MKSTLFYNFGRHDLLKNFSGARHLLHRVDVNTTTIR